MAGGHCSGVPDLHLNGEAVPGDDDARLLVLAERRALHTTIIIHLEIGSSSAASTLSIINTGLLAALSRLVQQI